VSGFDAAWLALREAADHRSRDAALVESLRKWLAVRPQPACLLDLGCGTGSNLRYLAPRLAGAQHWIGVDDDEALLARLARTSLAGVTVDTQRADLARGFAALEPVSPRALVASALMDLVSRDWLEALATYAREREAAVLVALSYDGRMDAQPAHVADATVRAAFNAHQRRDKGFGPALGPAAGDAVAAVLTSRGYAVRRGRSDWRLDASVAGDAALLAPLLDGIAHAACEQTPGDAAAIADWLARRQAQRAAGTLRMTVGHDDTLGLPEPQ
jgi:SAM-dependent methyltransferase